MQIKKTVMDFFSRLNSSYEKKRIMNQLANSYQMLSEKTIVMLGTLDESMGAKYKHLQMLSSKMKGDQINQKRPLISILGVAEKLLIERNDLERTIEQAFGKAVIRDVLDYRGLNLLHYVAAIETFNKYSKALTLAIVAYERQAAGMRISPADKHALRYVEDKANTEAFLVVLSALARPFSQIAKALNDLKGIQVVEGVDEATMGLTHGSTDVLRSGFVPIFSNIFLIVGNLYNEWVIRNYELANEEVEKLKLEVMLLEQAKQGTSSSEEQAALDKQISYYNNRIQKLLAVIEDIEEEAAA